MIIIIKDDYTKSDYEFLINYFKDLNIEIKKCDDTTLLLKGDTYLLDDQSIKRLPKVKKVMRITPQYRLASLEYKKEKTIINTKGVLIGGQKQIVISGSCSVESFEQINEIAKICKESGCDILRGGAFKPRTSPYFFQGLGLDGLKYLKEAGNKYNMPVVSEIVSEYDVDAFNEYVDIIQVGARNMQNYELLKKLGKVNKPILLKRNPYASLNEFLLSAEYILSSGNPNVILCERGVKALDNVTRYSLDFGEISALMHMTHLPVIVDPSHAAGDYHFVEDMTLAAFASNADGVMIEVHDKPEIAKSDSYQALKASKLELLVKKAREIGNIIGR